MSIVDYWGNNYTLAGIAGRNYRTGEIRKDDQEWVAGLFSDRSPMCLQRISDGDLMVFVSEQDQ